MGDGIEESSLASLLAAAGVQRACWHALVRTVLCVKH